MTTDTLSQKCTTDFSFISISKINESKYEDKVILCINFRNKNDI